MDGIANELIRQLQRGSDGSDGGGGYNGDLT